jgi:hypothetical protein
MKYKEKAFKFQTNCIGILQSKGKEKTVKKNTHTQNTTCDAQIPYW